MDGGKWVDVTADRLVSMHMWGLTPEIFGQLEKAMIDFLDKVVVSDPYKSECLILTTIGELIQKGEARVKVYSSQDTW